MTEVAETIQAPQDPPRDNLVRASFPAEIELRATVGDGLPTMEVGFARYGEWTEISSVFEGNFIEQIAPGAFTKTLKENLAGVRVLFNHGSDPSIGDKVLGPIESVSDGPDGPTGVVPLLDTSYNRDLLPGLRAGVYGASFRFRVMREELDSSPKRSGYNPKGLPERTIQECQLMEFGPVTFPAYAGATAGVRSLTDRFRVAEFAAEAGLPTDAVERIDVEDLTTLAEMIQLASCYIGEQDEPEDQANIPVMKQVLATLTDLVQVEANEPDEPDEPMEAEGMASSVEGTDVQTREELADALAELEPGDQIRFTGDEPLLVSTDTTTTIAPSHSEPPAPRRDTQPDDRRANHQPKEHDVSIEEMQARIDEIRKELNEIAAENRNEVLLPAVQNRWDSLRDEHENLIKRMAAEESRQVYIASISDKEGHSERGYDKADESSFVNISRPRRTPDDPFDVAGYHGRATSQEHLGTLYTEGAKRALESMEFPDDRADEGKAKANLGRVLSKDTASREMALRVINYGSPTYRRAFGKQLAGAMLNTEEQRVLGIATQGGQMPVPIQIDPTVTLVSNGVINPLRKIARNVTMTGYEWRGVSTTGVTSAYIAEGGISTDGSPTFVQPTIDAEQARCFVPFSFEVGQDWAGLEAELGACIADSKDVLEATAFLTGAGHASNLPRGVLRASGTVIGTAANTNAGTVFAVGNVYDVETALPPRFRPNASWVFNKAVAQRIRQFDTAGGASLWSTLMSGPLQQGMPDRLIGYPAYELSTMSTAIPSASGASWCLFGDFSQFIIADRLGMSISLIPHLFNGNTTGGLTYPVGMSGVFAYWRNSSDVMSSKAFVAGTQS